MLSGDSVKFTPQEFRERIYMVNEAMAMYGEVAEGNINKALELYSKHHDIEVIVDSRRMENMTGSEFDEYERPECPDCGSPMGFRRVPNNDEGIVTQLVCLNGTCDTVLDTKLSLDEWKKVLTKL